jgi:hypothetical protein
VAASITAATASGGSQSQERPEPSGSSRASTAVVTADSASLAGATSVTPDTTAVPALSVSAAPASGRVAAGARVVGAAGGGPGREGAVVAGAGAVVGGVSPAVVDGLVDEVGTTEVTVVGGRVVGTGGRVVVVVVEVVVVEVVVVVVGGSVTRKDAEARSVEADPQLAPPWALHAHTTAGPLGRAGMVRLPVSRPAAPTVHDPTGALASVGMGPSVRCSEQVRPDVYPAPEAATTVPTSPDSGATDRSAAAATSAGATTSTAARATIPTTSDLRTIPILQRQPYRTRRSRGAR